MPPPVESYGSPDLAAAGRIHLPDQRRTLRSLPDFLGRALVLYFYPKDDTPGCTVEGKEFRDLYDEFAALGAVVVGVSTDSVESHRRFAEKHALPFPLLADTEGEFARAFGVLTDDGIAERVTFVIGPDGRLRRSFMNVPPRGHAREVLNFVRAFQESHRMIGG
jgi:thioredoxin-dependent peroxiredoxin